MYPVRQSFSADEDLTGFGEVGDSGGGFFGVAAWHWRCVYRPDWLLFAYFVFIDDAPAHPVCCQTTFTEAIAECAVSSKKANAGSSPPLLQSQHKLHHNLLPQVSHMCVPAPLSQGCSCGFGGFYASLVGFGYFFVGKSLLRWPEAACCFFY